MKSRVWTVREVVEALLYPDLWEDGQAQDCSILDMPVKFINHKLNEFEILSVYTNDDSTVTIDIQKKKAT